MLTLLSAAGLLLSEEGLEDLPDLCRHFQSRYTARCRATTFLTLIFALLSTRHNTFWLLWRPFSYLSGAFDQLKQNATKARIPFYGR